MIRIAAAGDLHFGVDSAGSLRSALEALPDQADVLLLAGDLTKMGAPQEAAVLAEELTGITVPVLAVLGNHDYHSNHEHEVASALEDVGVRVLQGEAVVVEVDGSRLGVAGVKGFGGGFAGACGTEFGEPEMKDFIRYTRAQAAGLESALEDVRDRGTDACVALMHYSPIRETLHGEPLEIYPFLGSYLLAEAVDRAGADLALHGHAHRGRERGATPGGVTVRNVAQPVINRAFGIYCLEPARTSEASEGAVR
jgi:Icc-related predicted phosphoesterase